jgi:hypothetical protein
MKKLFSISIIILILCFVNAVFAYQPNKICTVYGAGNLSCGKYLEARQSNNSEIIHQFQAWLDGYLTAFTMFNPNADSDYINAKKNDVAILFWLDNYCKENPLNDFHLAVQSLVKELILPKKKRLK